MEHVTALRAITLDSNSKLSGTDQGLSREIQLHAYPCPALPLTLHLKLNAFELGIS
jgi:hypothetical protein